MKKFIKRPVLAASTPLEFVKSDVVAEFTGALKALASRLDHRYVDWGAPLVLAGFVPGNGIPGGSACEVGVWVYIQPTDRLNQAISHTGGLLNFANWVTRNRLQKVSSEGYLFEGSPVRKGYLFFSWKYELGTDTIDGFKEYVLLVDSAISEAAPLMDNKLDKREYELEVEEGANQLEDKLVSVAPGYAIDPIMDYASYVGAYRNVEEIRCEVVPDSDHMFTGKPIIVPFATVSPDTASISFYDIDFVIESILKRLKGKERYQRRKAKRSLQSCRQFTARPIIADDTLSQGDEPGTVRLTGKFDILIGRGDRVVTKTATGVGDTYFDALYNLLEKVDMAVMLDPDCIAFEDALAEIEQMHDSGDLGCWYIQDLSDKTFYIDNRAQMVAYE